MHIPDETVGRLFIYLRSIRRMLDQDKKVTSSEDLAASCGVRASVIRKDLSYFGRFGKRGVGYDLGALVREIHAILKLNQMTNAALVGVGNIGRAFLRYPGFKAEGIRIAVAFDKDPRKIGKRIEDVLIEDATTMGERIESEGIHLAIVAVPPSEAQETLYCLAGAGVRGVFSFTPCPPKMPQGVRVTCVDLAMEMASLVYHLEPIRKPVS